MKATEQVINHAFVKQWLKSNGFIKSIFDVIVEDQVEKTDGLLKLLNNTRDGLQLVGAYADGLFLFGGVYQGNKCIWATSKDAAFMEAIRQFKI